MCILEYELPHKKNCKFKENTTIFKQENGFWNVICKMSAICSQPQCIMQVMVYGPHFL